MADTEEDQTWLLALEAALPECSDDEEIINITRGRTLPEEHRTQIWQLCLGGAHKTSSFTHFDGIFDLQEQDLIRADCKVLVDKLDNEEEDKVTIMCSVESIFTHYCKSRGLRYEPAACWNHLLLPLLAAKMPADTAAFCFQELLEKYVPRENGLGAPVYHLLRLLLLYHDPELSTFLDSRKITPDLYAMKWVRSLFASVCDLQSVLAVWDVYLAEKDPFFVLFLAIVILVNAREQILAMGGQNKADIVNTLMLVPASLRTQDVQDFCALARFYVYRTPSTYRKDFEREIFGSVYLGGGREKKKRRKEEEEEEEEERDRETDLPLSQALCLSVSPEEILELSHSLPAADDDYDQVGFFLVDCRPAHQYNSGHIPTAFHLDPTLMLHQPPQFATAVQGLLLCQKCAVASRTAGQHLCFIGAGREEEDKYLNMVMAFFLQRSTRLVCVARGGYAALHDLLVHDLTSLADHDPKKCLVCAPPSPVPLDQAGQSESRILDGAKLSANGRPGSEGLANDGAAGVTNRFSSLSAVFKSRSAEMKDKLFDYITNPSGGDYTTTTTTTTTATAATTTTTNARHISSQDKGKLYRQGDIFSIEDEEEDGNEEEGRERRERERERERESLERVDFKELLKRKDFVNYFSCQQIKENGYLLKSVLVLTASQLLVVREGGGRVSLLAAERSLASILKITSKKRHPDLITFKYGTSSEGEAMLVTDMDRFLIPKASQATKAIKEQILKQMQEPKP